MAKKLACEEAADWLEDTYGESIRSKRLRAEARELKRLRRLVVRIEKEGPNCLVSTRTDLWEQCVNEAARIQKEKGK